MDLDFILRTNPDYIEELYRQYQRDPGAVGADWAHFFAGFEFGGASRPAAGVASRRSRVASTSSISIRSITPGYSIRVLQRTLDRSSMPRALRTTSGKRFTHQCRLR